MRRITPRLRSYIVNGLEETRIQPCVGTRAQMPSTSYGELPLRKTDHGQVPKLDVAMDRLVFLPAQDRAALACCCEKAGYLS